MSTPLCFPVWADFGTDAGGRAGGDRMTVARAAGVHGHTLGCSRVPSQVHRVSDRRYPRPPHYPQNGVLLPRCTHFPEKGVHAVGAPGRISLHREFD